MTVRAIILGLLIAAVVAGLGYLNDCLLAMPSLVGGHLPVGVFGLVLLSLLGVNPLLHRLRRSMKFRPAEYATMLALALPACSIAASGLMRLFTPTLVLPIHYAQENPGWRERDILSYTPSWMLANEGRYSQRVVADFMTGRGHGGEFTLADVPWDAWAKPLAFWGVLIVLCAFAVICLGVIVHRQWSSREHLPYPIARLAEEVLRGDPDHAYNTIFRNGRFWAGLGLVFVIQSLNLWHRWDPNVVRVPLTFNFAAIGEKWPVLTRGPYAWGLFYVTVAPMAVGFAYFVATEVSFSIGISQLAAVLVAAALVSFGADISGDRLSGGALAWHHFGGYLAAGLFLLYTGRRYYASLARRAFLFRRAPEADDTGTWAARLFLLSAAGMVAALVWVGLDWPFAVLTVVLLMLMFVVLTRINVETGIYMISGSWQALAVLLGLFGAEALGPTAISIVGLLCIILTIDPHESLMPFVVNALKVAETNALRVRPVARGMGGAFVIALVVAAPISLWANYHFGMPQWSSHALSGAPRWTYRIVDRAVNTMGDGLKESVERTPIQRLRSIRPDRRFLTWAAVGFALVAACSFLRLRFPRWPLHPAMFLVWFTWGTQMIWASFLLGWAIKWLVLRYGGQRAYRGALPFMVGVIAGGLLSRILFMIVGAGYFGATGYTLPRLW